MSTVPFRAPTAVPAESQAVHSEASPDSLIAALQERANEKIESEELTVPLTTGRWVDRLRIVYGYVGLDVIEEFAGVDLTHASNLSSSLNMLSNAIKRVEGWDPKDEVWRTVSDEMGPVKIDDRLTRLMKWPRPDDDWEFTVRQVYERLFEGNGLAVGKHVYTVAEWMGVTDEDIASGKASRSTESSSSPPPASSE